MMQAFVLVCSALWCWGAAASEESADGHAGSADRIGWVAGGTDPEMLCSGVVRECNNLQECSRHAFGSCDAAETPSTYVSVELEEVFGVKEWRSGAGSGAGSGSGQPVLDNVARARRTREGGQGYRTIGRSKYQLVLFCINADLQAHRFLQRVSNVIHSSEVI